MASHRLKRTMRGALSATAVIAAVSLTPSMATADPAASTDPLTQYQQLSAQAEKLNEQMLAAQNDLKNKQADLSKANADLSAAKQTQAQAQATIDQFRGQADQLAAASFEGAHFSSLSALLTGTNAQDFLERANMMSDLATDNATVLNGLQAGYDKVTAAEQRTAADQQAKQDATNAAAALVSQIQQQQIALNAQIAQVKAAAAQLTASDKKAFGDTGSAYAGIMFIGSGIRGQAMQLALTRRGAPYVWGAAGPSTFDCSGLVMWSYKQLGVSLPHSSEAQSTMGSSVSRANLQPGDLVFFGSPVHHVGIYVGNAADGTQLMVDAPTSGEVVKVQPLDSDYSGARRLGV